MDVEAATNMLANELGRTGQTLVMKSSVPCKRCGKMVHNVTTRRGGTSVLIVYCGKCG